MAGDWIKMRLDLQSHPKVVRILSATQSDKFRVIGGLHAVWGVFDQHSEDGELPGYTPDLMDHIIGWSGFCEAMIAVGWLKFQEPETLIMPEFQAHNGQSAKRRAEDQKRKRESRKRPQSVRNPSENGHGEMRTREEKRREDSNNPPVSPQGGKRSRGERLPADWQLPDDWRQWAQKNTPGVDVDREAAKFRDHWLAAPGAKGVKKDWEATWRNWCRRAEELQPRRNGSTPAPQLGDFPND